MELLVTLEGDDTLENAEGLKNFLENRETKGLESVKMARSEHKEGEQGLGNFLGQLVLKLTGSSDVIKGIVEWLNTWTSQHDTRLHLPNGVVIPSKKLTSDQIVEIVTKLNDHP